MPCPQTPPNFSWSEIDTILLDMDGTLLDKYFDDHFWEEYVPQIFARTHKLSPKDAKTALMERYRKVESTLQWCDLDYWSEQLGLNIPQMKCDIDHLIKIHPYVITFLEYVKSINKHVCLVTNAHPKTLNIKMHKTGIAHHFDSIVCAEEIGCAKEQPEFWQKLEDHLQYDKQRTLLADDTAKVLHSANQYGMGFLVFVARPSSKNGVVFSPDYPSITYFNELIH